MKKKILVFNGYYLPAQKYGGPTTSLVSIVENCSEDFQFYIVAANHDLNEKKKFEEIKKGWNNVGKAKVLYIDLKKINYNSSNINKLLKKLSPDMVWLVGILVPADKWFVARQCRKLNIPYLISPRGEVCENTFHLKYEKKKVVSEIANLLNVYKGAYFHATSNEEREGLVKYYKAPPERIFLVPNIAASLEAHTRSIEKKKNSLRIVFISRIQEKKNLLLAIKAVNSLKGNIVFDIFGPMESEEYWKLCQAEISKSPENIHIQYNGPLKTKDVSSTFKGYHCFLFPTISENYGHVIVEALSVSVPIILSKGTTPWDDIDGKAGKVCKLKDVREFSDALRALVEMNQLEYDNLLDSTAKYYNSKIQEDDAVNGHIKMLERITN